MGVVGGDEAHAEVVLEEGVDPVEGPPRPAAGHDDGAGPHDDAQVLGAVVGGIEADGALAGGVRADEDVAAGAFRRGEDPKLGAAGEDQVRAELLGRVLLGGDGAGSDDDPPDPLVEVGQVDGGGQGGRGGGGDQLGKDDWGDEAKEVPRHGNRPEILDGQPSVCAKAW